MLIMKVLTKEFKTHLNQEQKAFSRVITFIPGQEPLLMREPPFPRVCASLVLPSGAMKKLWRLLLYILHSVTCRVHSSEGGRRR